MPLSTRTPRLVWRAMASCGLQNGKINSYQEVHFSQLYDWQPHLVEGRTAREFLRDNSARVQARLTEENGGTRVDFDAVHARDEFDFWASRRFQRRLMPQIEQFLRETPLDWSEEGQVQEVAPPIASPTDFSVRSGDNNAVFESVLPLRTALLSPGEWLRCGAIMGAFVLGSWANVWGLVALSFAVWTWWNGRRTKKTDWSSLIFWSALAGYGTWQMVRTWF